MKAHELVELLQQFHRDLEEHAELWGKSLEKLIPKYPVRNVEKLREQSRFLARQVGRLRPYLERLRDSWIMHHAATGTSWDSLDAATGLQAVAPMKGPSMGSVLEAIDQILGHLQEFDRDDEISADHRIAPGARASAIKSSERNPTACVFIGHGRTQLWARVKVFLEDELHLRTMSYEAESRTGHSIVGVLEKMLVQATFAVLVFTADDETADGAKRARQNVVHEAGLFQGRLGFGRAVLLVQRGVESFSNIAGLQHIPFAEHDIEQTFYELQRVLKREGLVADGGRRARPKRRDRDT